MAWVSCLILKFRIVHSGSSLSSYKREDRNVRGHKLVLISELHECIQEENAALCLNFDINGNSGVQNL